MATGEALRKSADVNFGRSPTLALRPQEVPQGAAQVEFVAALALHSHRRDLALFHRSYVSIKTRGLLWYYGRLQRELVAGFFRAAFNHGAAQAAKSRMAAIISEAETATTERKRELLAEAEQLQAKLAGIMTNG